MSTVTFIIDGKRNAAAARRGNQAGDQARGWSISASEVERLLGWSLSTREGRRVLCHDDQCVAIEPHESRPESMSPDAASGQGAADGVASANETYAFELATLAGLLGYCHHEEQDARVVSWTSSADRQLQRLTGRLAPDFSLPDLAGNVHSLSDYRGKKVLLIAHASW